MKNLTKRSIFASMLIIGTMSYLYSGFFNVQRVEADAKRRARQAQAAAAAAQKTSSPTILPTRTIKIHYKNQNRMLDITIYPNQTIYDLKEHLKDELLIMRGGTATGKAGLKIQASWITVSDANNNELLDSQKIDALPQGAFPLEVEGKYPSIPRPSYFN